MHVLSSPRARWMPMLGFVSRGIANPEQGSAKNRSRELENKDNGTCGGEHRKLRDTSTAPS
jgi:hypothetical protein